MAQPSSYKNNQNRNTTLDEAQYIADYYYSKHKIFYYTDSVIEAKAEFYNKYISTGNISTLKLKRLNKALYQLFLYIEAKLKASNRDDIKDIINIVENSVKQLRMLTWNECDKVSTTIVQWIEDVGLTKLDIEQEDAVEQTENESF